MSSLNSPTKDPPGDKEEEVDQLLELKKYVKETEEKVRAKELMRSENNVTQWPPSQHFAKLDSSLKKNTAFVKKVRQFTSANLDNLLKGKYFTCSSQSQLSIDSRALPVLCIQ